MWTKILCILSVRILSQSNHIFNVRMTYEHGLHLGAARENFEFFYSWSFSHATNLWKLPIFPSYVIEMKKLFPKKLDLFSKFRWSLLSSKPKGPNQVIVGDFPIFVEPTTCALMFFIFIQSSCPQSSPCLEGNNPHPNYNSYVKHIGSWIQFLHWATHGTSSQNK